MLLRLILTKYSPKFQSHGGKGKFVQPFKHEMHYLQLKLTYKIVLIDISVRF